MSVVWRIALRNLQEHRAKSLIVGTIILIGTFVLVVGNSLMDSAAAGIRRSFIDNFTGHLVLAGVTDAPVSLFGAAHHRLPELPDAAAGRLRAAPAGGRRPPGRGRLEPAGQRQRHR